MSEERFIARKSREAMGRRSSHPQADPSQEVKGKRRSARFVRNDAQNCVEKELIQRPAPAVLSFEGYGG